MLKVDVGFVLFGEMRQNIRKITLTRLKITHYFLKLCSLRIFSIDYIEKKGKKSTHSWSIGSQWLKVFLCGSHLIHSFSFSFFFFAMSLPCSTVSYGSLWRFRTVKQIRNRCVIHQQAQEWLLSDIFRKALVSTTVRNCQDDHVHSPEDAHDPSHHDNSSQYLNNGCCHIEPEHTANTSLWNELAASTTQHCECWDESTESRYEGVQEKTDDSHREWHRGYCSPQRSLLLPDLHHHSSTCCNTPNHGLSP